MSNITFGEGIFLHNNPENFIKIWQLGNDGKSFVKKQKSQSEIALKGIIVKYLGDNKFLAFNKSQEQDRNRPQEPDQDRFMTFKISEDHHVIEQ